MHHWQSFELQLIYLDVLNYIFSSNSSYFIEISIKYYIEICYMFCLCSKPHKRFR